jgi:glutamate-ammonia-ligase adenylyltransferase
VSALLERIREALAGGPLLERLPHATEELANRHEGAAEALSPAALVGLARVVASQPETAGFLSHRKGFVARLADAGDDALVRRTEGFSEDAERIESLDLEDSLDALRLRRREEMTFAACLDLGGIVPFEAVSGFLSHLAESTLEISLRLARRETPGDHSSAFAVLGMGKLAGRELTYHSDLDLIFLYRGGPDLIARASRIGQRLIAYLTTMTGAGVAYEVDTRLRPSGRQGMLVTSFDAFEAYQMQTAATWEHLAQLRGRAVAGPPEVRAVLDRVHAHIL